MQKLLKIDLRKRNKDKRTQKNFDRL